MANYKSEFDITILHEVAARPILWDSRTSEYKDSEKKPALWLEIAEMLNSTPAAVKTRFDNMRGSYRRCKLAMNKSSAMARSGSGASKPPKPYKYAAEAAFLDAVFKMEPITELMDSTENSSNEVDEDMIDSISSAGENTRIIESNKNGRKRKKSTEPDFNTVLMDAVQSISKLLSSVMNSRRNEMADDLDDDWLFAKTIYVKLKDVPAGKEKENFKLQIQSELMKLQYGAENNHSPTQQTCYDVKHHFNQ